MLTDELAGHVAGLRLEAIAPPDVERIRHCLLDWTGAAIAGSRSEPARALAPVLDLVGATGTAASILGTARRGSAFDAALANGTASHSMELDDVAQAMGGHPSVSVCSAALALAEALDLTGAELLPALVAGYDVACAVGTALGAPHRTAGWHITGTAGTFAATAACARLLGLSAEQVVAAFGIAASEAAGLNAGIGTTAKPLHAGRAAAAGMLAATLVAQGADGPRDGIERFAEAAGGAITSEVAAAAMATAPGIATIVFKRHACCGILQALVTTLVEVREARGLRASDVEAIRVADNPMALALCRYTDPTTELEAKFSYPHAAAVALARTDTGLASFGAEALGDAELSGLRARVELVARPEPGTAISLRLKGGDVIDVVSAAERPAGDHELEEQGRRLAAKCRALASPVVGGELADSLVVAITGAGPASTVRSLVASGGVSGG